MNNSSSKNDKINDKIKRHRLTFLGVPLLVVALLYLSSCATPPPIKELAAAESAVAVSRATCDQCGEDCSKEELKAAESTLARGKALFEEFCSELEAQRVLIDAKTKADDAKQVCTPPPPPPPPPPPDMNDILFDLDRSNIRADAAAVLKENAAILSLYPNITVLVEGYADVRGPEAYNSKLAQERADAAKDFLVNEGIDPSRISVTSGGETEQFGTGKTKEIYQSNRRAHFVVTSPTTRLGARLIFKYDS